VDLEKAAAWVDANLRSREAERTGPLELVRRRPWGTVARAQTSTGTVWLKEPHGATAFEVPLYELLAELAPEVILVPLGLERDRGWVLLPDGGKSLGETMEGSALVEGMIVALRRYAAFQRETAGPPDRLLELGIADMRPAVIPERFDQAVEFASHFVAESGTREDGETLGRIEAHRAVVEGWATELSEMPGSPALDHNDLHGWNILGDPSHPETIRFYDWGDSVVAHPFAAAALPLGMIEREDPGALHRARDAYLGEFSELAPEETLVETLELACRCAKVARAHTWERAMRLARDEEPEHFRRAPFESLASLLDDSWTSRT
jgi:Phosphotransferase enzyme family